MRYIGYRWDEIAEGLDASSRLNVHWQRQFVETSFDGFSVTTIPVQREILVIEGDSDLIRVVQKLIADARTAGELT